MDTINNVPTSDLYFYQVSNWYFEILQVFFARGGVVVVEWGGKGNSQPTGELLRPFGVHLDLATDGFGLTVINRSEQS